MTHEEVREIREIKEAIEIIDNLTIKGSENCEKYVVRNVLIMAIEALEKQIPKKSKMNVEENYLGKYTFYHCNCPTCGEFIEGGRTRHPHHCICGQAIDWSDTE